MKKILPILFFIVLLHAAEAPRTDKHSTLHKSALYEWKFFDVNSIYCTINSAGPYADYLRTNSSGLFWPKGTFKTAVYTSGLWIIGKHRQSGTLRTATQYYRTEFQPGPISGVYNTSTNDLSVASDPQDARYRIYKINKGDNAANNIDYAEWPGDLGAPFIDKNGNGRWDNGTDVPKLFGDQTLWCVYNDLDTSLHRKAGTTPPMGMEVQALYYGSGSYSPLENTMFIRWTIINKSDAHYDSAFIGLFSDFDLGDANDDLNAYDSTLRLAYVFNSDNTDNGASGYGTNPPACGTVFLGGTPALHPYAHPIYIKTRDPYSDPPLGYSTFPYHVFNFMNGRDEAGHPNINPLTNNPDRFSFTGDPITNTGWTRIGSGFTEGDVRSLISLGPINLAPGDTQIVNAAFVIDQGTDRIESIKRLHETASFLNLYYDQSMQFPSVQMTPQITIDSMHYTVSVDAQHIDAATVSIECFDEISNNSIALITLADDGSGFDLKAGDNIFTKGISFPISPIALRIDAIVTENNSKVKRWPNIARGIPLSSLTISDVSIFSDDITQNGKVEPGENVRFGVTLTNPHAHSLGNVVVRIKNESYNPHIRFNAVNGFETVSIPYAPAKSTSFLSLTVPSGTQGSTYTVYLTITDSMRNQWNDSVEFPLLHMINRIATTKKISGRSDLAFTVRVAEKEKIKNHIYTLNGVDSAQRPIGLQLRDSTTGMPVSGLVRINFMTDILSLNHSIPQIDGFKINVWNFEYYSRLIPHTPYQYNWFSSSFKSPNFSLPPASYIHYGDIPNVAFHFSPMYPYDASKPYGRFWYSTGSTSPLLARFFPVWNNPRTQKAFLYSETSGYVGHISIPFTVFNITANPPEQLTVVLFRKGTTSKAQEWITKNDIIYIMADPYSGDGIAYDSSKGGMNIFSALVSSDTLPFYYHGLISPYVDPPEDTTNLELQYYPPISSRDVFTFNPSDYIVFEPDLSASPQISQNYPNPFNPTTVIMYTVVNRFPYIIEVYDILGRRVRTLLNEVREPGTYEIEWNGRDEYGIPVSSGMYLYRFSSEGTNIVKKMMLIK